MENNSASDYSFFVYCDKCFMEFEGIVRDNEVSFLNNGLIQKITEKELKNRNLSGISFQLSGSFLLRKPSIVKNFQNKNKKLIKGDEVLEGRTLEMTPYMFFISSLKKENSNNFPDFFIFKQQDEKKFEKAWSFVKGFRNIEKSKEKMRFKNFLTLLEENYPSICDNTSSAWNNFYKMSVIPDIKNLNWIEHKCLIIVNILTIYKFVIMLPDSKEVWKEIRSLKTKLELIQENNFSEIFNLFEFLLGKKILCKYSEKVFSFLDTVEKMRDKFLPIYLSYYQDLSTFVGNPFVLTIGVSEILHLYSEAYELFLVVGDLLIFVDNIAKRNKYDSFINDNYSLEEGEILYRKTSLTKGAKIKYFFSDSQNDDVSFVLNNIFDNNIRNAINHNDYTYDCKTQKLIYGTKAKTLYELSLEIMKLIKVALMINEVIWFFKKLEIPNRVNKIVSTKNDKRR